MCFRIASSEPLIKVFTGKQDLCLSLNCTWCGRRRTLLPRWHCWASWWRTSMRAPRANESTRSREKKKENWSDDQGFILLLGTSRPELCRFVWYMLQKWIGSPSSYTYWESECPWFNLRAREQNAIKVSWTLIQVWQKQNTMLKCVLDLDTKVREEQSHPAPFVASRAL